MMLTFLTGWIERRKKKQETEQADREIVERAFAAFAKKYPEREILRNWPHSPQATSGDSTIVCVVWNSATKPPSRSWWRMGDVPEELSYDDAEKLIFIPVWR